MKKNKIDYEIIAKKVLKLVGGISNVKEYMNCQTRLRINVKSLTKVQKDELSKGELALGVNISGQQVQVIYGTGKVTKMAAAFGKTSGLNSGEVVTQTLDEISQENKSKQKGKNQSVIQKFVAKFSGIFAPMILGFIGAGILAGVAGIIKSSDYDFIAGKWGHVAAQSWFGLFNALLTVWKATFLIIVGWRTAEAFGGTGAIGAIIAGLYIAKFGIQGMFFIHEGVATSNHYNFLGMHINTNSWFLAGFRPSENAKGIWSLGYASGSVFGVMMSAGIIGLIEKLVRKFVPDSLDTILTPTLTLLILLVMNILVIFSVSGYIFSGVSFMFENLYGTPFGAALLAAIFLITVVFGVHQGFVPIYAALMANTGINGLFPILAMGGASQVGMAIALWFRAKKNGVLRRQIQGAIIPGILGIGEPLIYGVSLPRVKPFITAMIGASFGGFFIGAMNLWGGDAMGMNTTFGPSGILATPLMTTMGGSVLKGVSVYLGGLAISYISGFGATYLFGHKNVDLA